MPVMEKDPVTGKLVIRLLALTDVLLPIFTSSVGVFLGIVASRYF